RNVTGVQTCALPILLLFNLDGAEFTRGAAEMERIAALQQSQAEVADLTIPQQLVNFIPANIFEDFANSRSTSIISVVIFSALTEIGRASCRERVVNA